MSRVLAASMLLAVACASALPQRRPVAVLYEDEPWSRGSVASATPVFALYDDGLVLYHEDGADPEPRYARVVANAQERAALERALAPGLMDLEEMYALSDHVHEPVHVLHRWSGGQRKTITVYGDLGEGDLGGGDLGGGAESRTRCPPEFLEARDVLRGFRPERATAWRPDTLLVRFLPQPFTPGSSQEPRPWPPGWPDLAHPEARRTGEGAYVLPLAYEHLDALAALRAHPLDSHAAVAISGRYGLVSYSLPFPCHERWDGKAGAASD